MSDYTLRLYEERSQYPWGLADDPRQTALDCVGGAGDWGPSLWERVEQALLVCGEALSRLMADYGRVPTLYGHVDGGQKVLRAVFDDIRDVVDAHNRLIKEARLQWPERFKRKDRKYWYLDTGLQFMGCGLAEDYACVLAARKAEAKVLRKVDELAEMDAECETEMEREVAKGDMQEQAERAC